MTHSVQSSSRAPDAGDGPARCEGILHTSSYSIAVFRSVVAATVPTAEMKETKLRETQSRTRSHTDGTGRPWAELWRLIPRPGIPIALRHPVTTLLGRDVRLHRSRGPVPVAEGIRLFLKQAGIEHLLCASHSPGRRAHTGGQRGGKHSVPGSLRPLPRRRRTPAPPQFRKAHIILVSVKTWLYLTLLTATIKILKMRILSLNVMTTQDSKKFLPQWHPANLRKQSS